MPSPALTGRSTKAADAEPVNAIASLPGFCHLSAPASSQSSPRSPARGAPRALRVHRVASKDHEGPVGEEEETYDSPRVLRVHHVVAADEDFMDESSGGKNPQDGDGTVTTTTR